MSDIIKIGPFAIHNDGNYLGACVVTGSGYGERRTGIYVRADHAVDAFGTIDQDTCEKKLELFGQRLFALSKEQTAFSYLEKQMLQDAQKNVESYRERGFKFDNDAETQEAVEVEVVEEPATTKRKAK